jgi:hypothetical protein
VWSVGECHVDALLHAEDPRPAATRAGDERAVVAHDREIGEMQLFQYGKASNRSVLSSMNQFAIHLSHALDDGFDVTELALELSDTPMTALGGAGPWKNFGVPRDVARDLLANWGNSRV